MDNNSLLVAAGLGAVALGGLALIVGGKKKGPVFLDKTRQSAPLLEKIQLSHDTFLFRFGLPSKSHILGLPVGKHFKIFGKMPKPTKKNEWNGREDPEQLEPDFDGVVERKYTPTSSDDDLGHFDLVIKVYRPGITYEPPRPFADGGKLSRYIDTLKVGDALDLQGPFGHIEYKGSGVFESSRKVLPTVSCVGMVAGGTGITPMLQIMNAILKNKRDPTKVKLLYANQTKDDILLHDMLQEMVAKHGDRVEIHYTLDRPPADWKGFRGFVTEEMLLKCMPKASEASVVLMCGPPVMIDRAVSPNLENLGFDKSQMLAF